MGIVFDLKWRGRQVLLYQLYYLIEKKSDEGESMIYFLLYLFLPIPIFKSTPILIFTYTYTYF